jgi:hypothetical protein
MSQIGVNVISAWGLPLRAQSIAANERDGATESPKAMQRAH